jgi:hypothetical protein
MASHTPSRIVTVGLVQDTAADDLDTNLAHAVTRVREAAAQGAQIICLQELFHAPYFCKVLDPARLGLAEPSDGRIITTMQALARELAVVLVIPYYEREAPGLYRNSAAVIDADGAVLGTYRKMHIPHDPLFEEKYYFAPGDVTEVVRVSAWHPAFGKSIVTMTGRESEREEYIAAMEAKREAEALAQLFFRERQEEERRAKLEAARATVRDFLLHHMESEDVNDWFAQLSDHHAAKPEIKHIIMTAIAKYLNKQNLEYDGDFAVYPDSCGYRYGESSIDDEVSDLSTYRRMRFIQQTIDDALEEDGGMGEVGFNVNPVKAWRPAEDGDAEDEIDEDGEVPMPDFFRVRCSVGDVTMNLYVFYRQGARSLR